MAPNDLTLWGMGTVRQLRPHWMLAELGLDYEYFPVHPRSGETLKPEFLKINPLRGLILRNSGFSVSPQIGRAHV